MPIGVIINVLSVVIGGLIGTFLSSKISLERKKSLLRIFAIVAIFLGITSSLKVNNVTIVVLSFILGTIVGELLGLETKIQKGIRHILDKHFNKNGRIPDVVVLDIALAITIFCFSGTGIYGAMLEGINGDYSILLAKSFLDFFTAMIFAASVGFVITLISIPQLFIYMALFFLAQFLKPMMIDSTIDNFQAVGGIIVLVLGLQLLNVKGIKVINTIPSLLLVLLFTYIWNLF
jgi:hypothetical protein